MTLAEAIAQAHTGQTEGFACLFHHTVPNIALAATVLGCEHTGSVLTHIYSDALHAVSSLRSPSDVRVWLGHIAYAALLAQPDAAGNPLPNLTEAAAEAYRAIAALPRQERTALLLLCAEGCSAPQAAEILSVSDLEVKRAMRRARQNVAAQMKQSGYRDTCNTAWLIALFDELRTAQMAASAGETAQVLTCVQTGTAYTEPEQQQKTVLPADKNGFFQKWFRTKRFG